MTVSIIAVSSAAGLASIVRDLSRGGLERRSAAFLFGVNERGL
jgi:hypothetical protein